MTTITELIATGNDDGISRKEDSYSFISYTFLANHDNVKMGWDTDFSGGVTHWFYTYLRFTSIAIPQGSTIDTAKISMRFRDGSSHSGMTYKIYAEDIDDSSQPTGYGDFVNATLTTANVTHTIGSMSDDGTFYDSPEINTIIQEIVNRLSWASGNDLTILLRDSEEGISDSDNWDVRYWAQNKGSGYEPKLTVTYSDSGGSLPMAMNTYRQMRNN